MMVFYLFEDEKSTSVTKKIHGTLFERLGYIGG